MISLALIWFLLGTSFSFGAQPAISGDPVDIANFARRQTSDQHVGLEWDEPRVIRRLEIDFEPNAPDPAAVHIDIWVSNWPPKPAGGWTKSDSRWQGAWREVAGQKFLRGSSLHFEFKPLTEAENPNTINVPGYTPSFRKTLKIRVRFDGKPIRYSGLRAFGESRWSRRRIDIETGCEGKAPVHVSATAYNGEVLDSTSLPQPRHGLRLTVRYTEHPQDSADRTILTIRSGENAFGVSMDDLLIQKDIYVRPFGVFLGDAEAGATFNSYIESGRMHSGEDIITRVSGEPEQSLENATGQIPALTMTHRSGSHPLRYYPLGFPGSREKYGLDYNGNLFISKKSSKAMKEDQSRMLWEGEQIYFRIGTGGTPDFRERERSARQELVDGWLPLVTTQWEDRGLVFKEKAYSTLVDAPLDDQQLRGDEASIAMLKVEVRNPQSSPATTRIWLLIDPLEELRYDAGLVLGVSNSNGTYPRPRLRAAFHVPEGSVEIQPVPADAAQEPRAIADDDKAAASHGGQAAVWSVTVPPAASRTITIGLPFRTFESRNDQDRIRQFRYGERLEATLDYWRRQNSASIRMHVPDAEFNRFQQSVLQHILVSSEKDLKTGYYMCPCGTYDYNMFANETAVQVRLLDMRGLHEWAWRCLRPIVELQGSKAPPGRFKETSAIFHGVRVDAEHDYTHSGYNLNHGWILWTMAEHYFLTHDKSWLRRVAPHMLRAADWVIEERQATKQHIDTGDPVPEYGLLPAGQLEDNEDFEYWFAVNGYAYRGLHTAAEALSEIDLAVGTRLLKEAAKYRMDIRSAALRAAAIAPVVPLRDGTFVPAIPPRTSLHGRDLGWIRNILYGPLTLVDCGVFDPKEPIAEWILQDYEDNLFMAEQSMGVPERDWFSRGGITLQPNLVDTPTVYMQRNQIPQALRALYNTFTVSYYPDVSAYTEWVPSLGTGGGPFFKTSDEAAFLTFLRLMLIREDGDRLCLNCGAPRRWLRTGAVIEIEQAPTYFGHIGFRIQSHLDQGFIEADITCAPDLTARELEIHLRSMDGRKISSVQIDGKSWPRFDAADAAVILPIMAGPRHLHIEYR